MKEFNFDSYQEWFNKNYSWDSYTQEERKQFIKDKRGDYCLGKGWFPEDGEIGMYEEGYEIGQLVFPEGIDIGTSDMAVAVPAFGTKPIENFEPVSTVTGDEFKEYSIDEKDFKTVDKKLLGVDTKVLVLPFLPKYIKFYEDVAIDYTGLQPRISLEDFLK